MLKIANHAHYFKAAAKELVVALQNFNPEDDFELRIDDVALTLCSNLHGQHACFTHSFTDSGLLRRARQKNQGLLKACSSKKNRINSVTDLTAGWGKDAFMLANAGLRVTMVEQHPLLFHSLNYLLAITRDGDERSAVASANLSLFNGNALEYLDDGDKPNADCYYLDPMFPAHKSTARPGKDLQLLQKLTENLDIEAVFRIALERAEQRVVVKRPLHAPVLDHCEPGLSYREKTVRFDVYLT